MPRNPQKLSPVARLIAETQSGIIRDLIALLVVGIFTVGVAAIASGINP